MKQIATFSFLFFLKIATIFGQQPVDPLFLKKQEAADSVEIETVVSMKNGGKVRGEMVDWRRGESVTLILRNGLRLQLPESEIANLKQFRYGGQPKLRDKKDYDFRERGWFGTLDFGVFLFQNDDFNSDSKKLPSNFSFAATLGYQESLQGVVSLGLGIDKYGDNDNMTIVPMFVNYRGYFMRTPRTPYFNLMLGRGFPARVNFQDNGGGFSDQITDKTGGLFVSPSIGIRLGARPIGNATIDFGWRYQKCGYEADNTIFGGGPYGRSFNYRRYTLRIGMVF